MDVNAVDRAWFENIETTQADHLKLDFALALERAIKHSGVSRSDLARLVNSSPAWITKVLRGDANLTIETMSELANAIEHEVHLHVAPKVAAVRWFEAYERAVDSVKRQETKQPAFWNEALEVAHERRIPAAA